MSLSNDRISSTLSNMVALLGLLLFTSSSANAHTQQGVIDTNGNEIIPCHYKLVQALPNGCFLLENFNKENVFLPGDRVLADHNGHLLDCTSPAGFSIDSVVLPNATIASVTMPESTIFVVHGKDGYAISDMHGKFVLPPNQYQWIQSLGEGMFLLHDKSPIRRNALTLFDYGNRKFTAIEDMNLGSRQYSNGRIIYRTIGREPTSGAIDKTGKVVFKNDFSWVGNFNDGLAMARLSIHGHFDEPIRVDASNTIISPSDPMLVYIDESGKILSPRFDSLEPFYKDTEEVAVARLGDRYGLINRKFQFITAKKYSSLQRLLPDLYAGCESATKSFTAFDSTGRLQFSFPPKVYRVDSAREGLIFTQLTTPFGQADEHGHVVHGVFNKSGELVWTTEFIGGISGHAGGMFSAHRDGMFWLINSKGEQAFPPQRAKMIMPTDSDRAIKVVDDERFNTADWNQMSYNQGYERMQEFVKFLRDYNLIGMCKADVIRLLGNANEIWLLGGDCGNAYEGLEIQYDGDKVHQWRFVGTLSDLKDSWIPANMRFKGESFKTKELILKR